MSYAAPGFSRALRKTTCLAAEANHAHSQPRRSPDPHRTNEGRAVLAHWSKDMCAYRATIIFWTIVAASFGIDATIVHAQSFPTRPVKISTDVGVGGTYDIFARALGEELHKKWGQPVIVETHPGSNGIIGARACAESPPDGQTFCVLSSQSLVANEFLFKKLPYSRDSFDPITGLFYNTQVLVVSTTLGVRTLDELAVLAKAKPGTLNYTVPGVF